MKPWQRLRNGRICRNLLVLACWFTCWPASSQEPSNGIERGLRVLTAAHSFHVFVPPQLREVAKQAGIAGHEMVDVQMIGGSRVIQHWELPDERNKVKRAIQAGKVDVLTVSPHLQLPDDGITLFTELLLKHNPEGRVIVQASWYPWDGALRSQDLAVINRNGRTIEELTKTHQPWWDAMEKQIKELNQKHGKQVVFFNPVAQAVLALRTKMKAGAAFGLKDHHEDLFTDPIGHARPPVQLLATYCNFAVIYRRSPIGLKLPDSFSGKISDELNRLLQELAWQAAIEHPLSGVAKSR